MNSAIASRIIKDTLEAGIIYPFDPKSSRKFMQYIPCVWLGVPCMATCGPDNDKWYELPKTKALG